MSRQVWEITAYIIFNACIGMHMHENIFFKLVRSFGLFPSSAVGRQSKLTVRVCCAEYICMWRVYTYVFVYIHTFYICLLFSARFVANEWPFTNDDECLKFPLNAAASLWQSFLRILPKLIFFATKAKRSKTKSYAMNVTSNKRYKSIIFRYVFKCTKIWSIILMYLCVWE